MIFFRQMDWKEFSNQPHIKKLPINEQMQQFSFHLSQMSNLNYFQPKGNPRPVLTPTPTPTPAPSLDPGWEFFQDTVGGADGGQDIKWTLDYRTYSEGNSVTNATNHTPEPGETKTYYDGTIGTNNIDEIRFNLQRRIPDDSTKYSGTISITVLQGTYGSINSLAATPKSLPYTFGPGTILPNYSGDEWTWQILNPSSDLRVRIVATEKP